MTSTRPPEIVNAATRYCSPELAFESTVNSRGRADLKPESGNLTGSAGGDGAASSDEVNERVSITLPVALRSTP